MIRFSIFSVLDSYEENPRKLPGLYQKHIDQITYAEQLGFDAYWIGEHHFYLPSGQSLVCPNPAIVLAAASQRTERIGLNTAVTNLSLRHPLLIAEDYAMVDMLSQGRLGFGIGRGTFAHEYATFGQNRDESYGRFEESWEIIQRAWRGESVTFQGRYYQIDGAKINVAPVQKPFPRYWFSVVKAESYAMRGKAAQPIMSLPHLSADGLQTLAKLAEGYRSHYVEAGGDINQYEIPLIFYTCVAPTRLEARQVAVAALQRYLTHQHHNADGHVHQFIELLEARNQLWFGTPHDLVRLIEQYQTAVSNGHFVFWLDFGGMEQEFVRRSMELLAQEVLPQFR